MSRPHGIVAALATAENVHQRGFTFVGAKGPSEDLFLSYHQLRAEAMKRAKFLLGLGLQRGDRLAMVVPDGQDFIPTFLAALWAGIVPVPLYPPITLGKLDAFMDGLVSILNVARPRILVTSERVGKVLWSAIGRIGSIEKVVLTGELAVAPAAELPPIEPAEDETAFLQFTSGSTATPKGVIVTHGSLAANAKAILVDGLDARRDRDVAVSWLPLYHDMGLIGFVLTPILDTISVVFIPTLSFIKNSTLWLETISKHKGTMSFAPNFAYALVTKRARKEQIARWDLSRMRVFGCGAEPINPTVMRKFLETFAPAGLKPEVLLPAYGMAEATLAMAFHGPLLPFKTERVDAKSYHGEQKAVRVDNGGEAVEAVSCGKTFPGHALSIQDAKGNTLPDRAIGEICFRGPSVANGYWESPEATRAAGMDVKGGWMRTGDLGYMVEGEVYVSGRLKDILIVNGRNYDPQRIEWLVDEIPGVRRGSAVVFTRPGTASEEVVVVAESRDAEPAKLVETIKARISEEVQLSVADVALVPAGSLPKTSSGKLQRRKTREQYLGGRLGRDAGRFGGRLLVARHLAWSMLGRARHEARSLLKRFGVQ